MKESQIATRKVQAGRGSCQRTKILGELLANLRGEKRTIMEGMLETVKTDSLAGFLQQTAANGAG